MSQMIFMLISFRMGGRTGHRGGTTMTDTNPIHTKQKLFNNVLILSILAAPARIRATFTRGYGYGKLRWNSGHELYGRAVPGSRQRRLGTTVLVWGHPGRVGIGAADAWGGSAVWWARASRMSD
jgi:hypothetical protein